MKDTSWLTQAFHQRSSVVRLASLHKSSASISRGVSLGWASAIIIAIISVVPVQGVIAICIASNVQEGENAKVSCHFDMDISVIKHDVLIYVYKNNERDSVFVLSWMEEKEYVRIKSGYFFDGIISNYIIITIPNATQDKAGDYKCIVPPSNEADTHPCTLTIKGKEVYSESRDPFTTTTNMTTESVDFTGSTNNFSDYRNIAETRTEQKMETSIIAAIVLGSLLAVTIAAFVIIIIVAWKKGLICSGKARDSSNPNPNTERRNHHELDTLVPNGQC